MTDPVIIIQARMSSTRMPGKVLRGVCGKPLLSHLVERMRRSRRCGGVVVATTTNSSDDPIAALTDSLRVPCVRGPEDDVLARYCLAARQVGADVIVRVTADCPLLDPATVDNAVKIFFDGDWDYVSTGIPPVSYPNGLGCEVVSVAALERSDHEVADRWDREHVTTFIKKPGTGFRCAGLSLDRDLSHLRVTVDTAEDFEVVRTIFDELYPENPDFGIEEVVSLLEARPDLRKINRSVRQKSSASRESGVSVVFRTDAGPGVGMGHLMRCRTLARLVPPGSSVRFVLQREFVPARQTLARDGLDAEVAGWGEASGQSDPVDVVVYDLTHGEALLHEDAIRTECRQWRGGKTAVTLIDGLGELRLVREATYPIDVLVVPYVGARQVDGAPFAHCLGPRFAVFDGCFADRPHDRPAGPVRILVTFGGSDPIALTLRAMAAVEKAAPDEAEVRVVVGPGFSPSLSQAVDRATASSRLAVEVVRSPDGLGDLLTWCDFAMTSTGLTKYEAALTGTPSIQLSIDAMHDAANHDFAALGTAVHLGVAADVTDGDLEAAIRRMAADADLRDTMAARGQTVFDRLGAQRIVDAALEARQGS